MAHDLQRSTLLALGVKWGVMYLLSLGQMLLQLRHTGKAMAVESNHDWQSGRRAKA